MKEQFDGEIVEMLAVDGFSRLYYKTLRERREENPRITNTEVFDDLNRKYKAAIGRTRYSSYESFQKVEKRKTKTK